MKNNTYTNSSGFTVIEMIVTIVVIAIFVGSLFQLFIVSESQRISVQRRSVASDMAYSNLDKVTSKAQIPTNAACNTATDAAANNLLLVPTANGSDLIANGTIGPEDSTQFPSLVSQKLLVTYPRGCDATMPAKITSIISYGNPQENVVHVSFVN